MSRKKINISQEQRELLSKELLKKNVLTLPECQIILGGSYNRMVNLFKAGHLKIGKKQLTSKRIWVTRDSVLEVFNLENNPDK